jgi:hypothetical protein
VGPPDFQAQGRPITGCVVCNVMGLKAHAETLYMLSAEIASIISTFFWKNSVFFPFKIILHLAFDGGATDIVTFLCPHKKVTYSSAPR